MTTVATIASWMKGFAPLHRAEEWDNVGLLWGDPAAPVERLMTCLTVTPESAAEAVAEGVGMIVSHHPILFRPVQRLTADLVENGFLWHLARAGVAIYSPHTAFDNCEGGINDGLAARLGLSGVRPLRPGRTLGRFKVAVYAPAGDREAVLEAAFAAGAGGIGAYEQCSFTTGGIGTFFGHEGTNPTVGRPGRREQVPEQKVEFLCVADRLAATLKAVRDAHSYEEPAIDVIPLNPEAEGPGAGRVGRLRDETPLAEFAREVGQALGSAATTFAGDPSRLIREVALCCGAGDDFLKDAKAAGADVLVTGEARFHRVLEGRSRGVGLVVAGHYVTERPGVENLADRLGSAFPDLRVWASVRESDPIAPA